MVVANGTVLLQSALHIIRLIISFWWYQKTRGKTHSSTEYMQTSITYSPLFYGCICAHPHRARNSQWLFSRKMYMRQSGDYKVSRNFWFDALSNSEFRWTRRCVRHSIPPFLWLVQQQTQREFDCFQRTSFFLLSAWFNLWRVYSIYYVYTTKTEQPFASCYWQVKIQPITGWLHWFWSLFLMYRWQYIILQHHGFLELSN